MFLGMMILPDLKYCQKESIVFSLDFIFGNKKIINKILHATK